LVPIYEQGDGRGIGHGLESFLARFEGICRDHQETDGTKSFAFIFYDFRDDRIKAILRDRGVFARLDRLSGETLSIFYLHASSEKGVERFNEAFQEQLRLEDRVYLPCVVFFKLSDDGFTDMAVYTVLLNATSKTIKTNQWADFASCDGSGPLLHSYLLRLCGRQLETLLEEVCFR